MAVLKKLTKYKIIFGFATNSCQRLVEPRCGFIIELSYEVDTELSYATSCQRSTSCILVFISFCHNLKDTF